MKSFGFIKKSNLADNLVSFISNFVFRIIRLVIMRKKHQEEKILIISLHKIGDSLFTLPAIKSIMQHGNKELIYLLVFEETKLIFRELLDESNLICIRLEDLKFGNRIAPPGIRKIIRKLRPHTIVDLTGSVLSASIIFNSSAAKIVGMNEKYFKNIYSGFINVRHIPHLLDRYCDAAGLLLNQNIDRASVFEYEMSFSRSDKILLHPFAGWQEKEWGQRKFIALAEKIGLRYKTALIFSRGEFSSEVLDYLIGRKIDFIETGNLGELISEIRKCSLFIGNDSGPVYLAAYHGKPTFTIYGPTNPDFSRPFGKLHKQVYKKMRCTPVKEQYCFLSAGRDCPSNECMVQLEEETVAQQVLNFINELQLKTIE